MLLSPEEVRTALAKASASWPDERRVAVAVAATRIQILSPNASQAQYVEAVHDAMGGQLRGVIDACLRAMAGDAGSGTASPLTQGEIDRLRHWVRHPEEELGRICLLALAMTGASVVDEARSALRHEDEDVRTTAVRALGHDSSAPARALLQGALANADAHVRAAAIEVLSREATPQERDAILALAQDRSRYVRGACIEAIRRERWEQGPGVLIRLLRDSYDAGPGMGEESVDHELASSAAKLLSEWTPPSSEWIPQLLQFVQDGLDANPDLSVHEAVLTMLEGFDDPRVAQGLSRRLERTRRKPHRLEGTLERAVLQTLSRLLVHSPRYATEVSIQAIITHAQNLEPGHAGIALIILGMLGQRAEAALSQLLAHEDYRAERALLCLFGSILVQGPRSAAAQKAVEQNALAKQLYGWAEGAPVDAPELWKERWRAHPALHAQLTAMREDEDGWPGFLASLLPALFGEAFRQGLG